MELEQKCRRQRNMLFEADDAFMLEEKKKDILKKKIRDLQSDKTNLEYDLRALTVAHQREIDDLRDKIADLGSRNHYLDCKVLELQRIIDDKNQDIADYFEKEKKSGMAKTVLRDKCNLLSHELILAGISAGYNQGHLIHYMKLAEYILDKYKRTHEAWAESNARRV